MPWVSSIEFSAPHRTRLPRPARPTNKRSPATGTCFGRRRRGRLRRPPTQAFARLSPEQRRKVLEQLRAATPEGAGASEPVLSDPQALARYATRAEIRQPGTLERTFGAMPAAGGLGFGGMIAGSLLGSMAGTVLGTAVAQEFLGHHHGMDAGGFDVPHAPDTLPDPSLHEAMDDAGGFD